MKTQLKYSRLPLLASQKMTYEKQVRHLYSHIIPSFDLKTIDKATLIRPREQVRESLHHQDEQIRRQKGLLVSNL